MQYLRKFDKILRDNFTQKKFGKIIKEISAISKKIYRDIKISLHEILKKISRDLKGNFRS